MLPIIQDMLTDWSGAFLDPRKRLFWGYLGSALLIALLWMILHKRDHPHLAFRKIFAGDVWCSESARADYRVFLINSVLMSSILPRLLGHAAVATFCFSMLHEIFAGRPSLLSDVPASVIAFAFTLVLFVVDDLARYVVHRMLHAVPVLWAFHKVHHSATRLNPMTVLRTHPVEAIVFAVRVSPAQHQIHHSIEPRHHDRNFGVALACWDRWFGTHCHSESDQSLRYGLGNSSANPNSLYSLYVLPFNEGAWHVQVAVTQTARRLRSIFMTPYNPFCRKHSHETEPS